MLVLSRKNLQEIMIGDSVKVTVLQVKGNTVRLGISAPDNIRVRRGELAPKSEPVQEEVVFSLTEAPAKRSENSHEILTFPGDGDSVAKFPGLEGGNRISRIRQMLERIRHGESHD